MHLAPLFELDPLDRVPGSSLAGNRHKMIKTVIISLILSLPQSIPSTVWGGLTLPDSGRQPMTQAVRSGTEGPGAAGDLALHVGAAAVWRVRGLGNLITLIDDQSAVFVFSFSMGAPPHRPPGIGDLGGT